MTQPFYVMFKTFIYQHLQTPGAVVLDADKPQTASILNGLKSNLCFNQIGEKFF